MSTDDATVLAQLATAVSTLERASLELLGREMAPGHAAYLAALTDRAEAALSRTYPVVLDALERSAAHQLTTTSLDRLAALPSAPSPQELRGLTGTRAEGRGAYANSIDMLTSWLGVSVGVARGRQASARALIGSVAADGTRRAPRFPLLAEQFATPTTSATPGSGATPGAGEAPAADPRTLRTAASTLERLSNDLPEADADVQRTELEHTALRLIAEDPSTASKRLRDEGAARVAQQRSMRALLAEAGLFKRGLRNGLMYYTLKMLPDQAEVFERTVDEGDNPRTGVGNRLELASQALDSVAQATGALAAPSWDDEESMPDWARDANPAAPAAGATDPGPESTGTEIDEPAASSPATQDEPITELPELSVELRRLTALVTALRTRGNRRGTGSLPGASVIVHLDYEKMRACQPGAAVTEHGLPLTAEELRLELCRSGIYPVVFGGQGQALDVGRAQRLFPPHMRRALAARDRGCIYPGCHMPAGRTEAHHIKHWEDGGETSTDNGCLLCPMHHIAVHAGLFKIVTYEDGSPPAVLLPDYLGRGSPPVRNSYWFAA